MWQTLTPNHPLQLPPPPVPRFAPAHRLPLATCPAAPAPAAARTRGDPTGSRRTTRSSSRSCLVRRCTSPNPTGRRTPSPPPRPEPFRTRRRRLLTYPAAAPGAHRRPARRPHPTRPCSHQTRRARPACAVARPGPVCATLTRRTLGCSGTRRPLRRHRRRTSRPPLPGQRGRPSRYGGYGRRGRCVGPSVPPGVVGTPVARSCVRSRPAPPAPAGVGRRRRPCSRRPCAPTACSSGCPASPCAVGRYAWPSDRTSPPRGSRRAASASSARN